MIEKPSAGRAKIFKNGNSIEVHVPAKRNWFLIFFLMVWLGGWLFGEVAVITMLFFEDTPLAANAFLLIWLTGWTVGGFFCMTILLWSIAGYETIKVENEIIEVGRRLFRWKMSKKYDINEIRHFVVNQAFENDMWGMGYQRNWLGLKGGILKFDYGLKTIKFIGGIEEAEARLLIELFKVNPNFREANFA